jgi:hypothetical protein
VRAALLWPWALVAAFAAPAVAQTQASPPSLQSALNGARAELKDITIPAPGTFVSGFREIAAGKTETGPIANIGTLRVAGTVTGDVFTFNGDIVLLPTGHITGSALALNGHVLLQGGAVDGDIRAIGGLLGPVATAAVPATASHTVLLTLGWAAVVLLVGIGVLVFGGPTLEAVGDVVDRQFGRSFLVGIAATLGIAPALALLVVGLALTILGILLIPFAMVAFVLAVIGLVSLGFLSAVRVTGHSLIRSERSRALSPRGASLRALVLGISFFLGLWLIAAVLTPFASVAAAARLIAFAITWAAATVGLGATIISRAGTRAANRPFSATDAPARVPIDHAAAFADAIPEWQTPTPVTGVVAAKRRSVPTGKVS